MSHVENVLEMCKRKGISVAKLERDLGFANAYIKGLKKGKIPIDRLQAIAEYLNVPVEQLLGEVDIRLDNASVLSDMDAFSRYLKGIGWEVIFNKEPHQEGYYTLRSEQLTVNISIEQYNDFENRIRNDCVDSLKYSLRFQFCPWLTHFLKICVGSSPFSCIFRLEILENQGKSSLFLCSLNYFKH